MQRLSHHELHAQTREAITRQALHLRCQAVHLQPAKAFKYSNLAHALPWFTPGLNQPHLI